MLRLLHVDYQKDHKHSGLNNVSFSIGKGEILGVAGVDGNGQSQLAQLVTGVISPDSGEVELNSHKLPSLRLMASFFPMYPMSRKTETKWVW